MEHIDQGCVSVALKKTTKWCAYSEFKTKAYIGGQITQSLWIKSSESWKLILKKNNELKEGKDMRRKKGKKEKSPKM